MVGFTDMDVRLFARDALADIDAQETAHLIETAPVRARLERRIKLAEPKDLAKWQRTKEAFEASCARTVKALEEGREKIRAILASLDGGVN